MLLEWGAYEVFSSIAARLPGTVPLATHAVRHNTQTHKRRLQAEP